MAVCGFLRKQTHRQGLSGSGLISEWQEALRGKVVEAGEGQSPGESVDNNVKKHSADLPHLRDEGPGVFIPQLLAVVG